MKGSMEEILRFVEQNDAFSIISHVAPDGDTIGSGTALSRILRRLGKRTENVCCDQVPDAYKFIPGAEEMLLPEDARGFDAVIAVDCADKGRLGSAEGIFDRAGVTANIDHHGTNATYADNNMIEETARLRRAYIQAWQGAGGGDRRGDG